MKLLLNIVSLCCLGVLQLNLHAMTNGQVEAKRLQKIMTLKEYDSLRELPHTTILTGFGSVSSIEVFESRGTPFVLASSFDSNDIKLFNFLSTDYMKTFQGHTGFISSVKMLPSQFQYNHDFVSASNDGTVKIWSIGKTTCCRTLQAGLVGITALEVYDSYIFSGARDGVIYIWDIPTGEMLKSLEGHTDQVNDLLYVENSILISASSDNTIRIWDLQTGQCLHVLKGHTAPVSRVCSIDQIRFASASADNTFKIWNWQTGECIASCNPRDCYIGAVGNIGQNRIVFGSDAMCGVYDCVAEKLIVNNIFAIFCAIEALKVFKDTYILVGGVSGNDYDKINIINIRDLLNPQNCQSI